MNKFVEKKFYVTGEENEKLRQIAKERQQTQQELLGDLVEELIRVYDRTQAVRRSVDGEGTEGTDRESEDQDDRGARDP